MTRLVADLGGTNVRFGLSTEDRLLPNSQRTYRNEDFGGFADAVAHYCNDAGIRDISEIVAAVAGPVTGTVARLTNRNWVIDAEHISVTFGGAQVRLLNDLTALGHAVPALGPNEIDVVLSVPDFRPGNQQRLVVGIGTGFNVCPVIISGGRITCLQAEFGHTPLPSDIAARIAASLPDAWDIATVEECFSGRGVSRLLAGSIGIATAEAQKVLADPGSDIRPEVRDFLEFYSELLAILLRNLLLAFMPLTGIYLAGSVARRILQSSGRNAFVQTYAAPNQLSDAINARVSVIVDDVAALLGCATFPLGTTAEG